APRMKKHLMIFAVVLLAIAVATPSFAAVEFKYGGQFRARFSTEDNVRDGTDTDGFYNNFGQLFGPTADQRRYNSDDNRRFIDQRVRLYFTFLASKNLKLVTRFEMGDIVWGRTSSSIGRGQGGGVGADGVNVELKSAYIEFNIPNTPTTAIVGIQPLALLDSWIVDEEFSAAVLVTKLDPFRVTLGYVAGQYGADDLINGNGTANSHNSDMPFTSQDLNVDDLFLTVDYAEGPFKASGIFFWQDAHRSTVSMDPSTLSVATGGFTGRGSGFFPNNTIINAGGVRVVNGPSLVDSNNLFDLGFNFTYKVDWLLAYVNFVKNLGSVDFKVPLFNTNTGTLKDSVDYTGFMVDAGVSYFCGPYTFNIGGFYTTGPDFSSVVANNGTGVDATVPFRGTNSTDVDWFTYPLGTSKYFSEIIGGGILGDDMYAIRGYSRGVSAANVGQNSGLDTVYWRGYGMPTNLWTITAGAAWQVAENTKISGSYWYFGTANSVPVSYNLNSGGTRYNMSSSIGHELDFYLDQKIVDGLTLTLVGAYLIADDAFAPIPMGANVNDIRFYQSHADDAFELGARLQWNF
ncbi:MAG: hypothetical protein AB9866_04720, partial [Syntrophobacteraceae bacterium]